MVRRVAVVGALAALAVFVLAAYSARRGFFDVGVYQGAVKYWFLDHGQLYEYRRPTTVAGVAYPFTYPPFAALVLSPLVLVGWHTCIVLSVVVNVAACAVVVYRLVGPVIRRHGWSRWYGFALAGCLLALFEPVRETIAFGQVNLVLLVLVLVDARLLQRASRFAGIGIGVAAAIKLTPVVFVGYLLVAGHRRAAAVAAATVAGATLLAAGLLSGPSHVYWTEVLWNTDRVGDAGQVANQSLWGALLRLDPHADRRLWVAVVAVVLAVWALRVRRAAAAADVPAGVALTGVAACLLSPVTWVHHLVWLLPALTVLAARGLPATGRRRWRLAAAAVAYGLLCSRLVWQFGDDTGGVGLLLGGSGYVWIALALLVLVPLDRVRRAGPGQPPAVPGPRRSPPVAGPAQPVGAGAAADPAVGYRGRASRSAGSPVTTHLRPVM